jgi:hypothetical protein
MKTYHWSASSGRIELTLHQEDVDNICVSGPNDDAVNATVKLPRIAEQLEKIPSHKLEEELSEYGCWDEGELQDRDANLSRLVWIAAWDVHEDPELHISE